MPVAPGEAAPELADGRATGLLASGAGPSSTRGSSCCVSEATLARKPFTVRPLVLSGSARLSSCARLRRTVLQGCLLLLEGCGCGGVQWLAVDLFGRVTFCV